MKSLKKEIRVTNHFIERYYERIFRIVPPIGMNIREGLNKVLNDIDAKISERDRCNLLFMKNCKRVLIPFENSRIVIKNGAFITILT